MEQHKRCLRKLSDDPRYKFGRLSANSVRAINILVSTTPMVFLFLHHSTALAKLATKQQLEVISVVRLSLDLLQAGSTLPRGYLWGGKLESWHVGLIGSVSGLIGIYQLLAKKQLAKQ